MADLTLHDGREIDFDLYKISVREWYELLDPNQERELEYDKIAKVTGLTVDDIQDLPLPDYRKLTRKFLELATKPDADPKGEI